MARELGSVKSRVKPIAKHPTGPAAWNGLLKKVIRHVEVTDPTRAASLKTALTQGRAERALRQLGIISEKDIVREFPSRTK